MLLKNKPHEHLIPIYIIIFKLNGHSYSKKLFEKIFYISSSSGILIFSSICILIILFIFLIFLNLPVIELFRNSFQKFAIEHRLSCIFLFSLTVIEVCTFLNVLHIHQAIFLCLYRINL